MTDLNTLSLPAAAALLDTDELDIVQDVATVPEDRHTPISALKEFVVGLQQINLNDDTATSFTPLKLCGIILGVAFSTTSTMDFIATYLVSGASHRITLLGTTPSTIVVVASGVLAGTTGTDGKVTISTHTDGKIYVENRSGGLVGFRISFLSGTNS